MVKSKNGEKADALVQEVLPDVWRIEGFLSGNFWGSAPSSTTYVLRDEDKVYIIDPGTLPYYKKKILDLVDMYEKRGVNEVVMLVTQGHFDHAANSDVVKETGLPWKFYLPEEEIGTTRSMITDIMNDFAELEKWEDVLATEFPGNPLFEMTEKRSHRLTRNVMQQIVEETVGHDDNHMVDEATILRPGSRNNRQYGSVTLSGWELGRFFISFDGSHSRGHICIYDPKYKIIFSGDTTIEINPPFLYSSLDRLIDITNKYRIMAREGYIVYAMDAHRSHDMNKILKANETLINKYELEMYTGTSADSEAFFDFFCTYYKEMKKEILAAHRRIGRATIGEIVKELLKSDNKYIKFKASLKWPELPSRLDAAVAVVLRDAGAVPIEADGKIVIAPVG
ncbi:MBL fold metallo-hydrolase [Lacrimispora sp. 38-1]|uniref:MBL fold metallo-hydrolase n=1 Tax=Lacrimispora sp. 38-1 TaxID=3125778 RepID=UPI003CF48A42